MPVKGLKEFSTIEEGNKSVFEPLRDTFLGLGERFGSYVMIDEESLKRIVDERVGENLKKLLEKKELIIFRNINEELAQKEIESLLSKVKTKGVLRISIVDILNKLNLPPDQIERVMRKLEKKGIKEIT